MKNKFPRLPSNPHLRRKVTQVARQFRKEPVIVDFYNSTHRLVVEIDGSIHDSQFEADKNRQDVLEGLGLNILRIKAELV